MVIVLLVLAFLTAAIAVGAARIKKSARTRLETPEDRLTAILVYLFQAIVSCTVGLLLTSWLFGGWVAPLTGLLIGVICIIVAERATAATLIPRLKARSLAFKTLQETSRLPPKSRLAKRPDSARRSRRRGA